MHVDAVGAAIDLGGAQLHQPHDGRLKARRDGERGAGPLLHGVGGGGKEVVRGHGSVPSVGSDTMTSRGPANVTLPPDFSAGRYLTRCFIAPICSERPSLD